MLIITSMHLINLHFWTYPHYSELHYMIMNPTKCVQYSWYQKLVHFHYTLLLQTLVITDTKGGSSRVSSLMRVDCTHQDEERHYEG